MSVTTTNATPGDSTTTGAASAALLTCRLCGSDRARERWINGVRVAILCQPCWRDEMGHFHGRRP